MIKSICVFCGSKMGNSQQYVDAAISLGQQLASKQIRLIYGGGGIGLMGTLAREVINCGGQVTGIIPEQLATAEVMLDSVPDCRVVDSMHTRKATMAEEADAFIAMPGGFGTYEELLEIITWGQLGIHRKPIGLLNIMGYYELFSQLVEHGIQEGFIKPDYRKLFCIETDPHSLLNAILTFQPIQTTKMLDLEQS